MLRRRADPPLLRGRREELLLRVLLVLLRVPAVLRVLLLLLLLLRVEGVEALFVVSLGELGEREKKERGQEVERFGDDGRLFRTRERRNRIVLLSPLLSASPAAADTPRAARRCPSQGRSPPGRADAVEEEAEGLLLHAVAVGETTTSPSREIIYDFSISTSLLLPLLRLFFLSENPKTVLFFVFSFLDL